MRISELKRKIENEFVDLFPAEQPFVVAKLEDQHGYSLSNNSLIGEFMKAGDYVYAQPEQFSQVTDSNFDGPALRGGGNT